FQAFGLFEDLRRDLGRGADREPVEAIDGIGEFLFVLAKTGLEIDLDAAILEDRDGGRRQRIGDEDPGSHGLVSLQPPLRGRVGPQGPRWGLKSSRGGWSGRKNWKRRLLPTPTLLASVESSP